MIDKEKIINLVDAVRFSRCERDGVKVVAEWIEQNQPTQQVVGLGGEQVEQLAHETFQFVEEFFCENEDIPVASDYIRHLKDWLKHEDFEQPNYSEKYMTLYDDYQPLLVDKMLVDKEPEQLKSQQFEPNWDDAPNWANWLAQDSDGQWNWYDEQPTIGFLYWNFCGECQEATNADNHWKQTLQERPKPTPQVEVGQVWNSEPENEEYAVEIMCMGKRNDGEDAVCYKYKENQVLYVLPVSDFLAKFEQVQS